MKEKGSTIKGPFSDSIIVILVCLCVSVAHFIHQRNKRRPQDEYHLNLAGIGLGNGWVDAIVQGGTV